MERCFQDVIDYRWCLPHNSHIIHRCPIFSIYLGLLCFRVFIRVGRFGFRRWFPRTSTKMGNFLHQMPAWTALTRMDTLCRNMRPSSCLATGFPLCQLILKVESHHEEEGRKMLKGSDGVRWLGCLGRLLSWPDMNQHRIAISLVEDFDLVFCFLLEHLHFLQRKTRWNGLPLSISLFASGFLWKEPWIIQKVMVIYGHDWIWVNIYFTYGTSDRFPFGGMKVDWPTVLI